MQIKLERKQNLSKITFLLPLWTANPPFSQDPKSSHDDESKPSGDDEKKVDEDLRKENECKDQEKEDNVNNTNNVNTISSTVNAAGTNEDNKLPSYPNMPALEDVGIFNFSNDDEDDGTMADMNNLDTTIQVSHIPTTRIHKDYPLDQVIGDLQSATQTRCQRIWRNMGLLVLFNKEQIIKTFKTACLLAFYHRKNPKRRKGDILLVQVYVDDIIFGSTKKELCNTFEKLMHEKFQMRYQVNPKVSHLHAVKRIFRYLKGQPKLGRWYLKDSPFDLVAYTDNDYARADLDRKSTTGEAEYVAASSCCRQVLWIQNQLLDYGKPKRKDTQVPQPSGPTKSVVDEAVHKELDDSLMMVATAASSLEANMKVNKLLDLEKKKTTQSNEIASLKRRVKKLEKKKSLGEDASKQGRRINVIDADDEITLVNDADNEMFDVDDLGGEEVFIVEQEVVSTGKSTTTTTKRTISSQQSHEKGKGIMIEEPVKPKKKDQIMLDEESAKSWLKDCKHKNKKSCLMQKRIHNFNNSLEKRKKHFTAKRAEEKRNKPPTQAQKKKIICTYLKNMEGYKLKDLMLKEFDKIQVMFDRAFKRVTTFEEFRQELVERKEKRAREALIQESTKKQKVKDDKEKIELKQLMKTIPDEEEVAIDAIPLAVKSPRIVD
nr:hypothetical protein [Tanacetum cinerariifolium]